MSAMIEAMSEASPRSLRLFLALWPDARVREALVRCRAAWTWPAGAALVQPPSLHLTLHFIGPVAQDRLAQLRPGLAVPFRPFVLSLDQALLWPHGLAVLLAGSVPPELADLHAALCRALQRLELPTEARAFRPHVTLARRAGRALAPPESRPLAWPVQGYALVSSMPGAGGYQLLERYA